MDHYCYIKEISEEGTEAAASTVVYMCRGARPHAEPPIPNIRVNKPFLYMITKQAQSASRRFPVFIGTNVNC